MFTDNIKFILLIFNYFMTQENTTPGSLEPGFQKKEKDVNSLTESDSKVMYFFSQCSQLLCEYSQVILEGGTIPREKFADLKQLVDNANLQLQLMIARGDAFHRLPEHQQRIKAMFEVLKIYEPLCVDGNKQEAISDQEEIA